MIDPPESRLGSILRHAQRQSGLRKADLVVLSRDRDPYAMDTPARHRDAQWFVEQVERFVPGGTDVHLRGLHYKIASAGDVTKPNGLPYENTGEDWRWLDKPAGAARWLQYVPFDHIRDERNEPPDIFVAEAEAVETGLYYGSGVSLPELESLLPHPDLSGAVARQPYRIVLMGEKSSLRDVLKPLARIVGGEMLLPTGDVSGRMLFDLVTRCAQDGRPAVVLYHSDFDPSGYTMPAVVAQKLMALRDLYCPALDVTVHAVALTREQCVRFELPSTPLKESEKRAGRWMAAWGREQTEIDALLALHPDALRAIALDAMRPYFDPGLAARVEAAAETWQEEARRRVAARLGMPGVTDRLAELHAAAVAAAGALAEEQVRVTEKLADLDLPGFSMPEPHLSGAAVTPLWSAADDLVSTAERLKPYKRFIVEAEGEERPESDADRTPRPAGPRRHRDRTPRPVTGPGGIRYPSAAAAAASAEVGLSRQQITRLAATGERGWRYADTLNGTGDAP